MDRQQQPMGLTHACAKAQLQHPTALRDLTHNLEVAIKLQGYSRNSYWCSQFKRK
jgi:hypothetical protein